MTRRHTHEDGRFGPFTYSIGLETPLEDVMDELLQEYPIPKPVAPERLQAFLRSLTFLHEAAHACQFVGTAWGLRTLRYTVICLRTLAKRPGWQLPILPNVARLLPNVTPEELGVVDSSLLFLDAMAQMELRYRVFEAGPDEQDRIDTGYEKWSPHFFIYSKTDENFAALESIGANVRKLPHLIFVDKPVARDLTVTVAALMETWGVLVELNNIFNALTDDAELALRHLPSRPAYNELLDYAVETGVADVRSVVPTLAACIDAALMYDPIGLFDVPWDSQDEEGRVDVYPGHTFLELCEAARHVRPIRALDDRVRFYRDICAHAGLPDPQWMAERSLAVAQRILDSSPSEETLLHRALVAHRDALKLRVEHGAELFAFDMMSSSVAAELVRLAMPALTFYDLRSLEPDSFDPRKIDGASIHSILRQALLRPSIECPLKMGTPFFCSTAGEDPNSLCVWKHEHGVSECWLDLLEKQLGLRPQNPNSP